MADLAPGLYEELLTERLRERMAAVATGERVVSTSALDRAEASDVLATHLASALARVLELIPVGQRAEAVNRLLEVADALAPEAEVLHERLPAGLGRLVEVQPAEDVARRRYQRPQIPLSRTDLLVNARGEPSLASEIAAELTSADGVDLLCAFVKWYGLRLVLEPIEELVRRGVPVRVLTTTYVGATERRALDGLVAAGAEVKVNYETQRTRLHAKAWLFRRHSRADTAYVGSSNLSRSALLDGLEWNVRISRGQNAPLIEKFTATFASYWASPDFEPYDPDRDGDRLDDALGRAASRLPIQLSGLEVRPFGFQQEILDRLDAERQVHGRWRNLVVAATGTGKTVMAALDYRRLRAQLGGDPTLLFVAHRKEILDQSRRTFAEVLADPAFGELHVAGQRPERWRHVFASIQSLTAYGVDRLPAAHFDVVVVDEFHHAEAATYQRLLTHVRPRVLLGLTATPERADGQDVTRWFGGHVAAELRLWEALEQELLSPFHYFGVADGTDLSSLVWRRGGYDSAQLDGVYTGNDARALLVLRHVAAKVPDPGRMRALGFCASTAHAAFMAAVFTDAGLPAMAVDAATPMAERLDGRRRLASGELRAIFSVDVFNEGLDVPEVDTVLFLRPTESATVFLQQLGRGLRHAPGKACLTVLDFIGQQHRRFRFDLRYRALTGASRASLERQLAQGFPFLPSGCHLELDRVAQRTVLEGIRRQVGLSRSELVADLRSSGDVGLAEYLGESGRELADVYRRHGSWTTLRRDAGLPAPPAGPAEEALLKRVHRLVHVDDLERTRTWRDWLGRDAPPVVAELPMRHERLATMLFFSFWPDGGGHATVQAGLEHLWRHPAVRAELGAVLALAEDRIAHVPVPVADAAFASVPLHVHCRYSREELLAGLGRATLQRVPRSDMQGVRYVEHLRADVFTFTLQKAERDYSPTTMYRDYAVAPDVVHWESQSTTSVGSATGRRYLEHEERGTHVLLFAREAKDDDVGTRPFLFLGPARYRGHEGSRPIAITWQLDAPMPADFFAAARLVAA